MGRLARAAAAAVVTTVLVAPAAFADEPTTVEIDPNAPLRPGQPVVLKNPALAAVITAALPLAVTAPVLVLKPGTLSTGLFYGAPVLAGLGEVYAGDPWRGLSVGIAGPLCVLAGWGAGTLFAQAGGADAATRAAFGTSGMNWGYGLFLAWAAADAYVTADLANKKAMARAGISDQ